MDILLYIVSGTATVIVKVLVWAILLRVLISLWVDEESPSGFYIFCCAVTEPFVAPTRSLLSRVPALQELPIDLSFFVTATVLIIIESIL